MNKTFNLLFFVKKSKIKANGTAPIYLRITIDGIPKEISSKRNIIPQKWDNKLQKVSGSSEEVKAINNYLKTLEHEVFDAHHQMMKDKTSTTAGSLKSKLVGTEQTTQHYAKILDIKISNDMMLLKEKFKINTPVIATKSIS